MSHPGGSRFASRALRGLPAGRRALYSCRLAMHGGAFFYASVSSPPMLLEGIRHLVPSTADFLAGKRLDEADLALEVVDSIYEAIVRGEIAPPRAFVGFSISGWLAWQVERQLVADGFESIPIVNFDGGATHLYYPYPTHIAWRERAAVLIERARNGPRAEMLLLHRPERHWHGNQYQYFPIANDWASLAVDIFEVKLGSLRHHDAML